MALPSTKLLSGCAAIIAHLLALSSCSFQDSDRDAAVSNQTMIPTRHDIVSMPYMDHGYNGDTPSFQLIDQINLENLPAGVEKALGERIESIKSTPPSLIYVGQSLGLGECKIQPEGARHIAEVYHQEYFLKLFSGPGRDWWKTMIESLEESHPCPAGVVPKTGVDVCKYYRPQAPVHPNFKKRLKLGVDAKKWILNGVRFRFSKSKADDNELSPPTPTIMAQMKLNFELLLREGEVDPTIQFGATIHSVAILPAYVDEFLADVLTIDQDPARSGCDIYRIFEKYIRNKSFKKEGSDWERDGRLKIGEQPRGAYNFIHFNVFDTISTVGEWRLTEGKVVLNDVMPFRPEVRMVLNHGVKTLMSELWESGDWLDNLKLQAFRDGKSERSQGLDLMTKEVVPDFIKKYTMDNKRPIVPWHENTVLNWDTQRALRIVPLLFPIWRKAAADSCDIILAQKPLRAMWWSGSNVDEGQLSTASPVRLMLNNNNDNPVPANDCSRAHEQAWTCAQCHARQVGTEKDAKGELIPIAGFHFRHIGFSDSANRGCLNFGGELRANLDTKISSYLMQAANGYGPVGLLKTPRQPLINTNKSMSSPPSSFFSALSAPRDGLDSMRCFRRGAPTNIVDPSE